MKAKSNNIWDIASPVNFASGKYKIKIITFDKQGGKDIEKIITGQPKHNYISDI